MKEIPDALKRKYPLVMWREAAAMRDVLIHDYPDVIPGVVWETVTVNIPKFKEQILTVIKGEGF